MTTFNIEERVEKAKRLFKEGGYNCCQAVVLAYNDIFGIDDATAAAISSGFGGGMGRMREVCGAVSGMTMVLSNKFACTDPNDKEKKAELYKLIQKAAGDFKAENGSIICRELLGLTEKCSCPVPEERTKEYYKKRPCSELVRIAAEITEKYLLMAE